MSADLTQEDCGYQSAFTYSKLTTETCSNLIIKMSGVFIVNFEHISQLVPLLTLNKVNRLFWVVLLFVRN